VTVGEQIFGTLFALGGVLIVVQMYLQSRVLRILRERHPEVFEAMGRPSLFLNNSIENTWRLTRFVWSSKGEGAQLDPEIASCARILRWTFVAYVLVFACILLAFFAPLILLGAY
jgi:hypothetical protein